MTEAAQPAAPATSGTPPGAVGTTAPAEGGTSTGAPAYVPPRRVHPRPSGDPLEIDLVYGVTDCGTCSFFWPADPAQQPYGPYPAFDLPFVQPRALPLAPGTAAGSTKPFPWAKATTTPEGFPTPEVLDGCRKAPIMTIGINPNLTAFAPGPEGASWIYPGFRDGGGADLYAKYAYYYRYRSVYQERVGEAVVRDGLLPEPRVVAPKPGVVVSAARTSDDPGYDLVVRYDGDDTDTVIPLRRDLGTPRWVVLVDTAPPGNRFAAGDVIAGRLEVPAGRHLEVYREGVGYNERFVPVLERFESLLRHDGHPKATLRMGEDVCQLDMVACASPHWQPAYLGGTRESEDEIIRNCVTANAWAVKQLVQTRPAVLYLVGESSYDMFAGALGALIERDPPLSEHPQDGAFTLLRETTDLAHPCYLRFEHTIGGRRYELRTRLVVSPHFSYGSNFVPQWRVPEAEWEALGTADPACVQFLETDPRLAYTAASGGDGMAVVAVERDLDAVLAELRRRFPTSVAALRPYFYDPDEMMTAVLADAYRLGDLAYGPVGCDGLEALQRTDGACRFCVNDRWTFPEGCPYGKPGEPEPPPGYLEAVARALVEAGGRTREETAR